MSDPICEVLFRIDPYMSVETLIRGIRQLCEFDVDIDLRQLEIEYDDNGMNPQCWITGDMPDTIEDWTKLDVGVRDIDGFEIDYESMMDWD